MYVFGLNSVRLWIKLQDLNKYMLCPRSFGWLHGAPNYNQLTRVENQLGKLTEQQSKLNLTIKKVNDYGKKKGGI